MKILIAGAPKTGTTGLFYKIKNSMPGGDRVRTLFEPSHYSPEPGDEQTGVLAKVLIDRPDLNLPSFQHFDKKIALIRDPRDRVISALLYGMGYHSPYVLEDEKVYQIVRILRQKEEDSTSISVLQIIQTHWQFSNRVATPEAIAQVHKNRIDQLDRFYSAHQDFYLVKYEDFVSGNLDGLEQYLGFPLEGAATVDSQFQRVVRTRGAGDWKNWFLEEDVQFFYPILAQFVEKYGYDTSWELPPIQKIMPQHSSQYYIRLINEMRGLILRSQVST
ncbi:MAG: hypothetical protein D6748_11590 [Calditrichaeota bacterium]|nr:MAG: hypothetical protein D6748_11590 [Calditrichota bacterium]